MVKFIGMECALEALAFGIEEQLDQNNCVCAACSIAFMTLYRSCSKGKKPGQVAQRIKKRLDKYWKGLKRGGLCGDKNTKTPANPG